METYDLRGAVDVIAETLGETRRTLVVGMDEAHEVRPVECFESVGDRGTCRFTRIALPPELASDGPPKLSIGPSFRIVEADTADELTGLALFHRPGPETAKFPVSEVHGHLAPRVGAGDGTARGVEELHDHGIGAKLRVSIDIGLPKGPKNQAFGLEDHVEDPRIQSAMPSLSASAVDLYTRLLRDEKALASEIEANLESRLRAGNATFGGRVLCPFAMPQFVSREDYDHVRATARGVYGATIKAWKALGPALHDLVGLSEAERELTALDPGVASPSPLSRLDSFLTPTSYAFVELNAETPAGLGYADVLSDVFMELGVMRELKKAFTIHRPHPCGKLLETLITCYRQAGGDKPRPLIAIVDYDEVPTRAEHHILRNLFETAGAAAIVCDPRNLTFEGGALRHDGVVVDIVYKRLLVNELLEKADEVKPLLEAARAKACVFVNPFGCKPIHKKAIFAILTDEAQQHHFSDAERAAIAETVPWTRMVREGKTTYQGAEIDLLKFMRDPDRRAELVLKPNDEYGGKGVFLGFESTAAQWDAAIATSLRSGYVVQRKVEIGRQAFPVISPGLPLKDFVVDLDPYLFFGEVEGFLTRLSGSSLANVTSGGGQVPAFVVEGRI